MTRVPVPVHPISDDDASIDRAFWDTSFNLIREGIKGKEASRNRDQDQRPSWFGAVRVPSVAKKAFCVIVGHFIAYWLIFSAAAVYFSGERGGTRLPPKICIPRCPTQRKKRTMYSAFIDACYCLLVERYGRIYDGYPTSYAGLGCTIVAIFLWTDFHFT